MKLSRGQVAVVTGGASGIGWGLAEAFAARGLAVALADVEASALEDAASRLATRGVEVLAVRTDVSVARDVHDLARRVLEQFGRVDIVCNNAGVNFGSMRAMWEIDAADWEWVLRVNLWGVIHGISSFVPLLVERGRGHVVNTASMAGLAVVPYLGPYTASKHAVVGLSESLAIELREQGTGVGVSVLCPGSVATQLGTSARNRPPELARTREYEGPGMSQVSIGQLEAGEVAVATLQAIEADRLHVVPSPGSRDRVETRIRSVLTDLDA
jgi:NAD(P)-dependent dehydrogenase (short-subunit alcohol dehydrogenase family)